MTKKKIFFLKILITYFLVINVSYADIQKQIINKVTSIKTLSFNFEQQIGEKKEVGKCTIKYPLLMKCDYYDLKQKTIISNGKTVAIIKKKYKKIYSYPIKLTPLYFILKKENLINLVRNNMPTELASNFITFELIDEKTNRVKIFFDKKTYELRGWETEDSYSNNVSFIINNLKTNHQIVDSFFKIPEEKDL